MFQQLDLLTSPAEEKLKCRLCGKVEGALDPADDFWSLLCGTEAVSRKYKENKKKREGD